jgi:hypothetical protein
VLVRRSRWILCPSPTPCPSSKKMNTENISHVMVAMWWSTVLLKVSLFFQKQTVDGRYSAVLQHW